MIAGLEESLGSELKARQKHGFAAAVLSETRVDEMV